MDNRDVYLIRLICQIRGIKVEWSGESGDRDIRDIKMKNR